MEQKVTKSLPLWGQFSQRGLGKGGKKEEGTSESTAMSFRKGGKKKLKKNSFLKRRFLGSDPAAL